MPLQVTKQNFDTFRFDFRDCKMISPTVATALMAYHDHLEGKGIRTLVSIRESRVYKFLRALGLFKPLATDEEDSYIQGLKSYSVNIHRCQNIQECSDAGKKIIHQVEKRLNPIKETLAALDYMIGEIWDNAGVHGYQCYKSLAYPLPIYISAFSYKNKVEVSILDRGQGIHNSLRKNNSNYTQSNAKQALKDSLVESVSGHPNGSAGFGLYSASEFVKRNGGSLHIWSSDRKLTLESGRISASRIKNSTGTLVTFVINALQPTGFKDILTNYDTDEYIDIMIRET